jgi:PAP2 superfamily
MYQLKQEVAVNLNASECCSGDVLVRMQTEDAPHRGRQVSLPKLVLGNLHWVATAIMVLALIPALSAAKLPFRLDWSRFVMTYWVSLTLRSIFFAIVLYIVAHPRKTLGVFWRRCWNQKPRLIFLALFTGIMFWAFAWNGALILIVDIIAVLELSDRGELVRFKRPMPTILAASAYLFVGLILLMCYNDVVASLKFAGTHAPALNYLDSILLGGWTVPRLANAARQWIPEWGFSVLGVVYFGMFGQLGTGLFVTSLSGRKRAFEYVGTLLIAFYIAIAVFYLWPTMGPFVLSSASLQHPTSAIQQVQSVLIYRVHVFLAHQNVPSIGTDYYIGIPCMHIADPLIVLWFLRKEKKIAALLIAYDVVLIAAILLLQWHFFSGLLGGFLVAGLAIYLTERSKSAPVADLASPQPVEIEMGELINA